MCLSGRAVTRESPRHATRPGGYLRVMKCGFRAGDTAPMAFVEITDRREVLEAQDEN